MTRKARSEINRQCVMVRHDRRRDELGIPEPTDHDRKLRRMRNQRYQQRLKQRAQQENAA